ncbi:DUF835 domain-containing protein [Thermococcus radiotolerans]|uniref:DUF835 domain-containing protein n=1 Tax=Thermococcus radiotolerans TaxID=187880 RepID=A0A2Z2N2R0_9EURY|nr:DUF835 domain-containing protein [Thermococcus radiotolerans]ASJ13892.1 hypothetical protein A3L10_01610 [Thermococcus radiotolerans]
MTVNLELFIVSIKLAMTLIFLRAFIKSQRKSALLLSLGWMASATLPAGVPGFHGIHMESVLIGISTSFTLLGILFLVEEETGRKSPLAMHVTLPVIPSAYGVLEALMTRSCSGTYVVSGVLLLIGGGVLIEFLSRYYHGKAKLFGMAILLSGIASMMYPLAYFNGFISDDVVVYLAASLALLTAYAYYEVIYSKRFLAVEKIRSEDSLSSVDIPAGVHILSSKDLQEISPRLEGFPALAFLRSIEPKNGWITYWIRTIEGHNTVPPTSLYKITQLVSQYFHEMKTVEKQGIVIVEAPEFLRLYNDFRGVLKMLSALRDMAVLFNGTLIIVTEKDVWKKEEWTLLIRTLR